jgi:hypothetical protein
VEVLGIGIVLFSKDEAEQIRNHPEIPDLFLQTFLHRELSLSVVGSRV